MFVGWPYMPFSAHIYDSVSSSVIASLIWTLSQTSIAISWATHYHHIVGVFVATQLILVLTLEKHLQFVMTD